jgi:hypothetical protein
MIIPQILLVIGFLGFSHFLHTTKSISIKPSSWKLNTSNVGKFEEFKRLFAQRHSTLEVSHFDLKE